MTGKDLTPIEGEIIPPGKEVVLKTEQPLSAEQPQQSEPPKLFVNIFELLNEREDGYFKNWNKKWRDQVDGLKAADEHKVK